MRRKNIGEEEMMRSLDVNQWIHQMFYLHRQTMRGRRSIKEEEERREEDEEEEKKEEDVEEKEEDVEEKEGGGRCESSYIGTGYFEQFTSGNLLNTRKTHTRRKSGKKANAARAVTSGVSRDQVAYIRGWQRLTQLHPGLIETTSVTFDTERDLVVNIREN